MSQVSQIGSTARDDVASSSRVWPIFVIEGLTTVGSTMLMVGIFFYTKHRFHWDERHNLVLAVGQGAMYACGALLATKVCARFGNAGALVWVYAVLVILAAIGLLPLGESMMAVLLLAYVLVAAITWPALEGLVCRGVDAHRLSRRIGIYNLVWAGIGAVVFAIEGWVIDHWESGIFILAVVGNLGCLVILLATRRKLPPEDAPAAAHIAPEPDLLRVRRIALWLSRIALPATFVALYSMVAMMPSLSVMRHLDTTTQTLAGSTWLGARWLTFLLFGATTWWHTRPRILLAAAAMTVVAFVGITLRPVDLVSSAVLSPSTELLLMIFWQIVIGVCMGIIYAGSLYFGMVLSEGSTEHGGYHEALIGLGSVIGPGFGAWAQTIWPDNLKAGVAAVTGVLGATVIAAMFASFAHRRAKSRDE